MTAYTWYELAIATAILLVACAITAMATNSINNQHWQKECIAKKLAGYNRESGDWEWLPITTAPAATPFAPKPEPLQEPLPRALPTLISPALAEPTQSFIKD